MTIALIGPSSDHELSHRVRGSGIYSKNLIAALKKYYPENSYILTSSRGIPSDIDHFLYFEPFFRTLPILKKRKRIVTVHDLTPLVFPKDFRAGIKGNLKWQLQKLALKNTDLVITDSNSSKKDISKFTGIDPIKIKVIYLAAEEEFKKINNPSSLNRIKNKYNLPDKFALYVGDVTWNKNLPRIISAVRQLNITLVMVGSALVGEFDQSNPWNQDLVKVRKMSQGDKRIIMPGFVEKEDLPALYNLATVFVMPSLYEGFGLPILEAMKCGCSVVTSKEGSLKEVAGDAAFFVNPYDISEIANGIGEVYFNKEVAEKLSKKGLRQAEKFSWKKTALETINAYKLALDQV